MDKTQLFAGGVYSRLKDDLSKFIFKERVLYSVTKDFKHIVNIVNSLPEAIDLFERLGSNRNIIFGAGIFGKNLIDNYPNYFVGIVDNNELLWGKEYNNLPISSPKDLLTKYSDCQICISVKSYAHKTPDYNSEILMQLKEAGIPESRIINFGRWFFDMEGKQYFDLPWVKFGIDEVFVDAGCFDGRTSETFMTACTNWKHIYAFECGSINYSHCKENLKSFIDDKRLTLVQKGLYSSNKCVAFSDLDSGTSCINDFGHSIVETVSLDAYLSGEKVTFIKMDIEGAEAEALKGAKETICEFKPKLAICVYHKPEDILLIPQLILEYNDTYEFSLRHYSIDASETVLYAY